MEAVVDLMVPQGAEYDETFTFYTDQAMTQTKDLGVKGWSGKIVIRDKMAKYTPVVSTTVDFSNADLGEVKVVIPGSVTAQMRTMNHDEDKLSAMPNYVYVVVAENGGVKRWIMRGDLSLIPDPEK